MPRRHFDESWRNPERGLVRYEVTAYPHDAAVNGELWESGHMSPAAAAAALRRIADSIERDWSGHLDCNCAEMTP